MSTKANDKGELRREGDPRFLAMIDEMEALHARKQRDYGTSEDPLANLRASEEWGHTPAWVGAMMRACDKVKRLKSFYLKGSLANEGVIDAFMDLAVYAILSRILYEEAVTAGRAVSVKQLAGNLPPAGDGAWYTCHGVDCGDAYKCARYVESGENGLPATMDSGRFDTAGKCKDFLPKEPESLTDKIAKRKLTHISRP